jgi:hypothetical protein
LPKLPGKAGQNYLACLASTTWQDLQQIPYKVGINFLAKLTTNIWHEKQQLPGKAGNNYWYLANLATTTVLDKDGNSYLTWIS